MLALAVIVALVATSPVPEALSDVTGGTQPNGTRATPSRAVTLNTDISQCPWLLAVVQRHEAPTALARLVVGRMTLADKLGEIVLVRVGPYENADKGVPRLCIPSLTLQDGPQGLAFGATDVTQLPAPLGIAATFDPSIARQYGEVQGAETHGQGIDVVQGPTLNVLRVPESGRAYEGYGEDPLLVSVMGVADIKGIQSQGVMAQAKHVAVYSQETDRGELNDVVSDRALNEIYLPPFKAAVGQAHVASAMCAYPQLDGTFQCQDARLTSLLAQWGFTGFVRSDLGAGRDPVAAITAGTDLIKPASARTLDRLVREGRLPVAAVDSAVTRILSQMFAYDMVGRDPAGSPGTPVDSAAHAAFALHAAERSAVLLKNTPSVLPLDAAKVRSVAVIGADARTAPVTTGYGSAQVTAPFVSDPLAALRRRAGRSTTVTYSDGGSTTAPLPPIPTDALMPTSGVGHGLTLTLTQTDPDTGPRSVQAVQPTVDLSLSPHPSVNTLLPTSKPSARVGQAHNFLSPARSSAAGASLSPTRAHVVLPAGWTDVAANWSGTLTPPRTGLYTLSLQGSGGASLTLDGVPAVSDTLSHARGRWSQTVQLVGGHPYRVQLNWEPFDSRTPSGETLDVRSALTLGWQYVSDRIAAAVAAAARAQVAVVFAGDFNSEAFDRPSLSLPGDESALIAAVAAANPRTVVVLHTGGPVLMPWLGSVAGVIEGWYPGEQDGTAIAALLYGDVDPSGRLPVTFPGSDAQAATNSLSQWPGVNLTAVYSEGLQVGYRYDHANGIQPLFPFGYGLSYTRFTLGPLSVVRSGQGYSVTVEVTNSGTRVGTDVPQAYLSFPASAGEPPAQLAAFSPVTLGAGQTSAVTLTVPGTAFQTYQTGAWSIVPGSYTVSVGESSSDLPLSVSVPAP